jgi:hypothetical protein
VRRLAPHIGRFTPRKDSVPILQETGWAPGSVWTGASPLTVFDPLTVQAVASRYPGPQEGLEGPVNYGTEWKGSASRNPDTGSDGNVPCIVFTVRGSNISRHTMTSWFDDFTLAKWRDLR